MTTHTCQRIGVAFLLLAAGAPVWAVDRITVRDGVEFVGDVELDGPQIVIKSGPRIVRVSKQDLLKPATGIDPPTRVVLPNNAARKSGLTMEGLVAVARKEPFDGFGRRTVVFLDTKKNEIPVYQSVDALFPTHVSLRGINRQWHSKAALSLIPDATLVEMLRKTNLGKGERDQLRIVTFLIEAERFVAARKELQAYEKKPELKSLVDELQLKWSDAYAGRLLEVAIRALNVGQMTRCETLAKELVGLTVSPAVDGKRKSFALELSKLKESLDRAQQTISGLVGRCSVGEFKTDADAGLAYILENTTVATLGRLQPLVEHASQAKAEPDQLIALGISGWSVGADLATKEIAVAVEYWRKRGELLNAIGSADDGEAESSVARLLGDKTSVDLAIHMLPLLPAPKLAIEPNQATEQAFRSAKLKDLSYVAVTPTNYDCHRKYPLLVVLPGGVTSMDVAKAMGTLCANRGVILVAPQWRRDEATPYRFTDEDHATYLAILQELRKTFAVDCDAVFLAGIEMGGVAAWDFAAAHPDDLAGVLPFTGPPQFYPTRYLPNFGRLPVYAVESSFNGLNSTVTSAFCRKLAEQGCDAIFAEYQGLVSEVYPAELPLALDWMSRKRRQAPATNFQALSLRLCDNRFYWAKVESFADGVVVPTELYGRSPLRPAKLEGKVTDNNTLQLQTGGVTSLSLYLPAKLLHYDDKNLTVRVNRKQVHKGVIEPDLSVLVHELRRTGDLGNLVVKKLTVTKP